MNIPKYKCHKEVQALKIKEVEKSSKDNDLLKGEAILHFEEDYPPVKVDHKWIKLNQPEEGGYYLFIDEPGTEPRFILREVFDKCYSLVGEQKESDITHPEAEVQTKHDNEVLEQMADKIIDYVNRQVTESNDDEYFRGFVAGQLKMCEEFGGEDRAKQIEALLHHESRIWVLQNLGVIKTEVSCPISDELPTGKEESNEPEHGPAPQELQPNERPTYQSTSTVSAIKIKTIEYSDNQLSALVTPCETNVEPFTINQAYIHTQHPGEGGYHVITEQGQHLFHTAEWFEKNFQPSAGKIITLVDMSDKEDAENYRQLENEITEMYEDESNDLVTIGEHVADHFGLTSMGE